MSISEHKNIFPPAATIVPYDPMKGTISTGSGVPAGQYTGVFKGAEYLPEQEPDGMTGKGGRQFACVRYQWEIAEGDYKGKLVATDTPTANGVKSRQYQVISWLLAKSPSTNFTLTGCVDKRYLLTLGSRSGKSWIEVTNAMLIPNQQ